MHTSLMYVGLVVASLSTGCIEESASTPESADVASDAASGAPDAAPQDARGEASDAGEPLDVGATDAAAPAGSPDICQAFDDALAAVVLIADSHACTRAADCVEVERCPGELCNQGVALNVGARDAVDARAEPEQRCETCGTEGPPNCPEPEPIPPGCEEGVCSSSGEGPGTPPMDCESAEVSLARAMRVVARASDRLCVEDADCVAVEVFEPCGCHILAVNAAHRPVVEARLTAHLRFNACDTCPPPNAPCTFAGRVPCVDGRCTVAE